MTIGEKWFSQLEVFHNIVVLLIARERSNPLNQSNGKLLMTSLSVSFKASIKAMNTIKFQIYDLLQLYVKNNKIKINKKTGTVLYPNDLPVNTLTHLCTNDFNFCAVTRLGKSEIAKINVFHFGPKTAKI